MLQQFDMHLGKCETHVVHLVPPAESLEARDRAGQLPARGVEPPTGRVQRGERGVGRRDAFRVAGTAEQHPATRDLAHRVVEAVQSMQVDATNQMGAPEPHGLVERFEQADRLRIAALGGLVRTSAAIDRAERHQHPGAQHRLRLRGQFREQVLVSVFRGIQFAGAKIDVGALHAHARLGAQCGGRGVQQRLCGVEAVREHVGARLLQQACDSGVRIGLQRFARDAALQVSEQVFAGLARRIEHLGRFAQGLVAGAFGVVQDEGDPPTLCELHRGSAHETAGPGRLAPATGVDGFVPATVVEQADHGLARHDRLAAVAQVTTDRIHDTERDPGRVGTRGDFHRQNHDRAGTQAARVVEGTCRLRHSRRLVRPPCRSRRDHDAEREYHRADPVPAATPQRARRCRNRVGVDPCGVVGPRHVGLHRPGFPARGRLVHRRDPAIAETRHGAQHLLVSTTVTEHPARLHDREMHDRIAHVGAAPDRRDQLVAADRACAVREQVRNAIEYLRRKQHQLAVLPHLAGIGIDVYGSGRTFHAQRGLLARAGRSRRYWLTGRHAASLSQRIARRPMQAPGTGSAVARCGCDRQPGLAKTRQKAAPSSRTAPPTV